MRTLRTAVSAALLLLATTCASHAYEPNPQTPPGVAASVAVPIQGVDGGVPVPTSDTQNAPFPGNVPMTVGVTYAAARSVGVLATVAGNVSLQFSDASTITLPVSVGWQTFPFAVTKVISATATATYYNLK